MMTYLDTKITSDGAGGGVSGVGGSQHHTTSLDSVETLPHHRNHGAAKSKTHYQREIIAGFSSIGCSIGVQWQNDIIGSHNSV